MNKELSEKRSSSADDDGPPDEKIDDDPNPEAGAMPFGKMPSTSSQRVARRGLAGRILLQSRWLTHMCCSVKFLVDFLLSLSCLMFELEFY